MIKQKCLLSGAYFLKAVRFMFGLLGIATIVASAQTPSQPWPSKTVRIVVPYPAGGSTDILARLLAKKMSDETGQIFIVDNRAGANGNLGAASVASSVPDGYTLLFTTTGPLVLNKFIYKKSTFNPDKDFVPIVKVAEIPLLVAVHPSIPVNTLAEFVTYSKANPGQLTYSTAGNGSMGHLTAELLQRRVGISMTHVPYKGSALALNDLVAGVVKVSFDLAPTYAQFVQNGKVRALAVTTLQRSSLMPQTPTLVEQGLKNFEATGWNALVGPVGMPALAVQKLNAMVNAYVQSEEGKLALHNLGMQASGGTPQQLGEYIESQSGIWQPIASSINVE